MKQHLSAEQIDGCVIGERTPEVEAHLQACDICAAEVAGAAGSLASFGQAMRTFTEQQMPPARPWSPTVTRSVFSGSWRLKMSLALAMLLLLVVAVPGYRHGQIARQRALAAAQDEILLRNVEQEVARSVPAPMEPLAKLMPQDLTR